MHLEGPNVDFEPEPPDKQHINVTSQRLDTIYDDKPLGFRKDNVTPNIKMLTYDPLEEIDLGDGVRKRPMYISINLSLELKVKVIQLMKEYKYCFAWDYSEMPVLSRDLVELKFPIKPRRKPIKQNPRRFAS